MSIRQGSPPEQTQTGGGSLVFFRPAGGELTLPQVFGERDAAEQRRRVIIRARDSTFICLIGRVDACTGEAVRSYRPSTAAPDRRRVPTSQMRRNEIEASRRLAWSRPVQVKVSSQGGRIAARRTLPPGVTIVPKQEDRMSDTSVAVALTTTQCRPGFCVRRRANSELDTMAVEP